VSNPGCVLPPEKAQYDGLEDERGRGKKKSKRSIGKTHIKISIWTAEVAFFVFNDES
jgi:hypothetical protein